MPVSAKPVEFWIRTRGLNADDFRAVQSNEGDEGYDYIEIFKERVKVGEGTDLDCVVAVYEAWGPVPLDGALRIHVAEPGPALGKEVKILKGSHMKSATRIATVLYDAGEAHA